MCIRKILDWLRPDPLIPVTPVEGNRIALLFAIDNYPGTQNDLPDCIKDQNNVADFLALNYPEFKILKFTDSMVTTTSFRDNIKNQVTALKSGDILLINYSGHGTRGINPAEPDGYSEALYLWNDAFWDQEWSKLLQLIPAGAKVIIVLDSCFAHGSTETKNIHTKVRFVQTQVIPEGMKRIRRILKGDMLNYLVFAACEENQTSTSTGHGGVFTIYWLKAWQKDYTYFNWNKKTADLIELTEYEQNPNIEGDELLINQKIFT